MLSDFPDRIALKPLPRVWTEPVEAEVILYDTMCLHGNDGSHLDRLIATGAKILIYSRVMRPDLRARAIAKGCSFWVSMGTTAQELVEAIELRLEDRLRPGPEENLGHDAGLTPREVEVLTLIAQGLSNKEITERLELTANTLKSHVRAIYRKIGVNSRARAVAWAVQDGFPAAARDHGRWRSQVIPSSRRATAPLGTSTHADS